MRLVGYIRVSTREQAEHGMGLDIQERAIRSWCKAHRHRLVKVCGDEGISGSNGIENREGIRTALAMLKGGRADGLVVRDLDRLARELGVQEAILAAAWATGRAVFTVSDGEVLQDDPDDPMRRAMRQMRGVFSELEAGLIRKRVREGRERKKEQGGYVGGAPPLGKRSDGGELVVNKEEQRTLQRIKTLHKQGLSLGQIATTLNDEATPTKRGGRWYPASVQRALDQIDPTRKSEREAGRPNWRRLTR